MKINRLIIAVLMTQMAICSLRGQTYKAFVKAADESFLKKDYYSSLVYNLNALEFDSTRIDRLHAAAEAARSLNSYKVAEDFYKKVVDLDKKDQYSLAKYHLAEMKQAQGKYQEAKEVYNMYLTENKGENAYYTQKADKEIRASEWAISQVNQTMEGIQVSRLGEDINTSYSEFGGLRIGDSLIYSSLRFERAEEKAFPKKTYSNLLMQVRGVSNEGIQSLNNPVSHTAHTAINTKNNRMYFTLCEYINAADIRCDMYYRDFSSSGYGEAKRLPDTINAAGYTTTQPAIGYDVLKQQEVLYWVSDRRGGKGKLDIWYAYITGDTTFSVPMNLEALNTSENDITPFFHQPASELYFSTDGRIGMGGFDVYKAVLKNDTWLQPEHMGVPLNTSYNDIYFTVSPDGKKGLLSSNRVGSLYLDALQEACCYDIYNVDLDPARVRLIVSTFDKNTLEELKGAQVSLDNRTDQSIPAQSQSHKDDNDYEFPVDRNKEYNVEASKPGYRADSVDVSTYGINRSQTIEKKIYLETDTIHLDVFTFDKKTQAALQGTEITLIDLSDAGRTINRINPHGNDFHFPLIRGHQYRIIANKKAYNPAVVTIDTREVKANKITENMFLDIGDIYSFLPLILFFDNDQPDIRSYKSRTDKFYSETFPPYYARKEEFKDQWSSKLKTDEIPQSDVAYETFFNDRLKKGNDDLSKFLDILIGMLERGDKFEIFLKGYASPRASTQYNLILSQRRIFSVKNELLKYNDGILKKYLDNKQLNVMEKPFGEMTAPKKVNDNIKDTRSSVFSLDASNERRVEIVEVIKNK